MLVALNFWPALQAQEVRVHTIGDSTMADYVENTTRTRGWGEMLQEFFTPQAQVINYARGGRSSRSFCVEGLWDKVKSNMQPGDYVLIQFAHNDEKEGGKDGDDFRGTAPWTTYKSFLEKYVDETLEKGGVPVFVTPIIRRYFMSDGTISPKGCHDLSVAPDDSTLNYVRVMKHVAREKKVALVDMTQLTKDYAEQLGPEKTIACIYVPTDGTHTQATGAAVYAQLAARQLKRQGILSSYITSETPLVLNPTKLDFGTMYVGDQLTLCFDLTGLALSPVSGTLRLEAPKGMTLSDGPDADRKPVIEIPYTDGKLWNQCFYLHFKPAAAAVVSSGVKVTYGSTTRLLPVTALCKAVSRQTPVTLKPTETVLKSLIEESGGITIEGGNWPADIDESGARYVEVVLVGGAKTINVKQLTLTLNGKVAYRIACARGKDFYPRTDLGENQQAKNGVQQLTFPINMTLQSGGRLHVRLFPWSIEAGSNLYFKVEDWLFKGIEVE